MSHNDIFWQNFYERQARGEIPYDPEFYVVDRPIQEGSASIQLVTPTEQQVEQARAAVKQKIAKRPRSTSRKRTAKPKKRRKVQRGGKKRRPIKRRKAVKKKHLKRLK